MPELSQQTKKLIQRHQDRHYAQKKKKGAFTIHVDEVASAVAAFYEKVRGVVDWKEEHLMKRAAIQRNIRRRLLMSQNGEELAESLVLELIRGGHFPNDQIEEVKIQDIKNVLKKYFYIIEKNPDSPQLLKWLLDVAACEIEEILSPPSRERALIQYMTELMKEKIKVQEGILVFGGLTEEEKNTQIYIAVQRALFKLDSPIVTYHLLQMRYPQWKNLPASRLEEISSNINLVWQDLERKLSHSLADKFYNICERYDTPYLLLGDVLAETGPEEFYQKLSKPEILADLIKEAYLKRLSTLKSRTNKAAILSTASIFLANSFVLLLPEIPLATLLFEVTLKEMPLAIAVDILGPTFLMFLLVITNSPASKSNLDMVVMETMKIVYERKEKDTYEIRAPRRQGFLTKTFIGLIYFITAVIVIIFIAWLLQLVDLPPTSVVVNVLFTALIAFAGMAVRQRAEELTVEKRKVGGLEFILDIIFLPIIGLGKWLSTKWKRYNAVATFFAALIDLPFQVFVEFLEQWRSFLKAKKEEIH